MTANNDDHYDEYRAQAQRLQPDVGEAFAILKAAMHADPSYAYGWHANIAMALYDNMPQTFWMPDKSEYHKITNDAASNFMMRAFEVETSVDMLIKEEPERFPKGPKSA